VYTENNRPISRRLCTQKITDPSAGDCVHREAEDCVVMKEKAVVSYMMYTALYQHLITKGCVLRRG